MIENIYYVMTICLEKAAIKNRQFTGLILVAILITLTAAPLPAATKDLKPVREVSLDQAVQEALEPTLSFLRKHRDLPQKNGGNIQKW